MAVWVGLVNYPNAAPHGLGTASQFISLATIESYPLGLVPEPLFHVPMAGSAVIGVEAHRPLNQSQRRAAE